MGLGAERYLKVSFPFKSEGGWLVGFWTKKVLQLLNPKLQHSTQACLHSKTVWPKRNVRKCGWSAYATLYRRPRAVPLCFASHMFNRTAADHWSVSSALRLLCLTSDYLGPQPASYLTLWAWAVLVPLGLELLIVLLFPVILPCDWCSWAWGRVGVMKMTLKLALERRKLNWDLGLT